MFNFGNRLLNLEKDSHLIHYQFKVLNISEYYRVKIIRSFDSKEIALFQFEFNNYSHPGNLVEDLAKEYQWQKSFKANQLVYGELYHIAHLFGVEVEYNHLISYKTDLKDSNNRFGAELYVECFNDIFNYLVKEFKTEGSVDWDKVKELKKYYTLLKKNGWTLNSDILSELKHYTKHSTPEFTKNMIRKLQEFKDFGDGFFVFSYFHKEWRFEPSKNTIIQIEEFLRNNINYWKYE